VVPGEGARARDGHLHHARRWQRRSPPIIAWLASRTAGRATFIVTGLLGFVAAALAAAVPLEKHPWITEAERAHHSSRTAEAGRRRRRLETGLGPAAHLPPDVGRCRRRFITDPIWWLYIFWLPSYFQEVRGFSLQQVGWSAWLPFLCAGIGALGRMGVRAPHSAGMERPIARARR